MFLGLRKLGNICCGQKMFLNKIRNIICVPDTKFVSATNVVRADKRGSICVCNNVSATMQCSFARALKLIGAEVANSLDRKKAEYTVIMHKKAWMFMSQSRSGSNLAKNPSCQGVGTVFQRQLGSIKRKSTFLVRFSGDARTTSIKK